MKYNRLSKYYNQFVFYKEKHGYFGLFSRIFTKLRWAVDKKEILYYFNLDSDFEYVDDDLILKSYSSIDDLSLHEKKGILENNKNEEVLNSFLLDLFKRGGTLWLAISKEEVVGLLWTFRRGFKGFYSVPLTLNEYTVVAVEVF